MITTITLFRTVGAPELTLIQASGWRRFPPRVPDQPLFYPVLSQTRATDIAREWNGKDGAAAFVLRFAVHAGFVRRYPARLAASTSTEELWVPAVEMDELNRHLLSRIDLVASFVLPSTFFVRR